ncbi:TetR/AcrR family transcriptional regulator (plasmid) [Streptomyces sp. NBC_00441]|uniref:TetR/AcrR family transcriptional regulator n=1 Tax=Streptomyces sp. NBC_00441 TaxID=2975742 RepID=UPI002E2A205E|nr:TetR/AcrR family transcriptional regulator [Streptomyces sp. NBC_00441]
MAKRVKALRTRALLLEAAASAFSGNGFHGTSLAQVVEKSGMTMGALTYHFASKDDLADAVEEEGAEVTRSMVRTFAAQPSPPLTRLADLLLGLARLLEEDPLVQCAVRLSRERSTAPWSRLWLPLVTALVDDACKQGQVRAAARPDDVTELIRLLLHGTALGPDTQRKDALARLRGAWQVALGGITAEPEPAVPA